MSYSELITQNIVDQDHVINFYMDMDENDNMYNNLSNDNSSFGYPIPSLITTHRNLIKKTDLETDYLIENILCYDILDKIVNSDFRYPFIEGTQTSVFDIDRLSPNNRMIESYAFIRRIITKILNASNYIATESGMGPGEFVLMGKVLFNLLSDSSMFFTNGREYYISGMKVIVSDSLPTYNIYVYRTSLNFFINENTGRYGLYSDKEILSVCVRILNFMV